jgi:hypothetical protein
VAATLPQPSASDLARAKQDEAYADMSTRLLAVRDARPLVWAAFACAHCFLTTLRVARGTRQGWTMLGEHCPISGFPLLRKGAVTWSVRCQMVTPPPSPYLNTLSPPGGMLIRTLRMQEVRADGGVGSPQAATAPALATAPAPALVPAPAPALAPAPAPAPSPPVDSQAAAAERLAGAYGSAVANAYSGGEAAGGEFDSDTISQELSELLLKGAPPAHCSRLVNNSARGPYGCTATLFAFYREPGMAGTARSEPTAHLAAGWRMLDEDCPLTHACPLMQQKGTGRKFSVGLPPACLGPHHCGDRQLPPQPPTLDSCCRSPPPPGGDPLVYPPCSPRTLEY